MSGYLKDASSLSNRSGVTEALIGPPTCPLTYQPISSSLGGSVAEESSPPPPRQLSAVKLHQRVFYVALMYVCVKETPPAWATWCTHPVIFYPRPTVNALAIKY